MGHKVFISYKYADTNVKKITNKWQTDTVRDCLSGYRGKNFLPADHCRGIKSLCASFPIWICASSSAQE